MPANEQIYRPSHMKFAIKAILLVAVICAVSYGYHRLVLRWAARRKRGKLLAELMALPPVKMDFSTPEGATFALRTLTGAGISRRRSPAGISPRRRKSGSRSAAI